MTGVTWAVIAHRVVKSNSKINMTRVELAHALQEAWGNETVAAIWTCYDVSRSATVLGSEYEKAVSGHEIEILNELVDRLESEDGQFVLDDLIREFAYRNEKEQDDNGE